MTRRILGIVAGYLAMSVGIMVTFMLLYVVLGADRSFRPGTYDASGLWLVASFLLGLIAAVLGGWAAAHIGGMRAVRLLAILVIVVGIALAIPTMRSETDPGPRTGPVSTMEAMQKAKQPHWVTIANPLIGAVGVFFGGRRRVTATAAPA